MTNRLLSSLRTGLARLTRDRRGNIAITFALLAVPLVLGAGASIDLARMANVHGQVQDIADSAALAGAYQFTSADATAASNAATVAGNYAKAMAANLPDHPTVATPVVSSSPSCAAPAASPGQVTVAVCTTTPGSTNGYIGTVHVALNFAMKTTLTAMVTPSMTVNGQATAQGGVAVQVTVNVNHFNSSASDLDQVFYYAVPQNSSGAMLSGRSLYEYDPTNDIANNKWLNSSKPILSNAPGFTNANIIYLQVPIGTEPAFAMYNTTSGVSNYGNNCYGQTPGQLKKYFSTRTQVPTSATLTTQYYDYQAATFNTVANSVNTKGDITAQKCSNSQGSNSSASDSGGTDSYASLMNCNTSCSNLTWNAGTSTVTGSCTKKCPASALGNYLYTWGSSRNPLQFGNLNRNSTTGVPTGGTTDGLMVTDCSQGAVTYNWDDNGGAGNDDNDFNDIVFAVSQCTTTGVQTGSVRLLN